jgi:hypothetical protein
MVTYTIYKKNSHWIGWYSDRLWGRRSGLESQLGKVSSLRHVETGSGDSPSFLSKGYQG